MDLVDFGSAWRRRVGDGVRVQVEDAFGLPWVRYRIFDWVYPNAEI